MYITLHIALQKTWQRCSLNLKFVLHNILQKTSAPLSQWHRHSATAAALVCDVRNHSQHINSCLNQPITSFHTSYRQRNMPKATLNML